MKRTTGNSNSQPAGTRAGAAGTADRGTGAVPDRGAAVAAPARPAQTPSAAASATAGRPTVEDIRRRAYEIYQARKGANGTPESDWAQAERELMGQSRPATRPNPMTGR